MDLWKWLGIAGAVMILFDVALMLVMWRHARQHEAEELRRAALRWSSDDHRTN